MISIYPSHKLPMKFLRTQEEMKAALTHLMRQPALSLDTETTGLDWWNPAFDVFYLSICDGKKGYGFLHPCAGGVLKSTRALFANKKQVHIYHNYKFDAHALRSKGIDDEGMIVDTMVLSRLLNENEPMNLDYQSQTYLGPTNAKLSESIEEWFCANGYKSKEGRRYDKLPLKLLEPYAVQDVISTWFLWKGHVERLKKEDAEHPMDKGDGPRGLSRIAQIEMDAIKPLVAIEERGYLVNPDHFKRLGPKLEAQADAIRTKILSQLRHKYGYKVPSDFNLGSPDAVAEIFIGALNFDPDLFPRSEKTGELSFSAKALEALEHPIADLLLEYREEQKLASSFGPGLLKNCSSDLALHVSYNQVLPVTGRMSCSAPNLQNLPRVNYDNPDADRNQIRKGFLARKGYTLFYFDYSQIEMRIAAYYFQDPVLLRAIREGLDLHRETAAVVYGIHPDKVTKEQRQKAKTINFATIYGSGARGLSKTMKVPYPEAKAFRSNYLLRFPKIKQFFKEVEEVVVERGFTRTYYGRRRRLNKDQAHIGVNAIVQGTATGDIHKIGLSRVHSLLKTTRAGNILSPIHDELGIEIRNDCLDIVPKIRAAMQDFNCFDVPLDVDVEFSKTTWGDKKKWKH